ncbi:uncharacterized protein BYT42DRAFT_583735 [Radiomyces spectabilis]|uniref:uncharacterized protein n=1 Tax=Radiomyces spectabilis TaxID=64574 RepID=UPI002220B980|nr:uncharacterized protein BYT42DRAFT_583735 [Radiomyces spectabilis]KAI8369263.1 hypothetical protein BYT42DRAFT_583735 [Radiomyces spectabilis]
MNDLQTNAMNTSHFGTPCMNKANHGYAEYPGFPFHGLTCNYSHEEKDPNFPPPFYTSGKLSYSECHEPKETADYFNFRPLASLQRKDRCEKRESYHWNEMNPPKQTFSDVSPFDITNTSREELIQQAVWRLRGRLLEEGLADMVSQVVTLQAKLETLRLEASASLDAIYNLDKRECSPGQLDVFERRLSTHQKQLREFLISNPHSSIQPDTPALSSTAYTPSGFFTRLSRMSSLFSRNKRSESDTGSRYQNDDAVSNTSYETITKSETGNNHHMYERKDDRRQRVKQFRQQYQTRTRTRTRTQTSDSIVCRDLKWHEEKISPVVKSSDNAQMQYTPETPGPTKSKAIFHDATESCETDDDSKMDMQSLYSTDIPNSPIPSALPRYCNDDATCRKDMESMGASYHYNDSISLEPYPEEASFIGNGGDSGLSLIHPTMCSVSKHAGSEERNALDELLSFLDQYNLRDEHASFYEASILRNDDRPSQNYRNSVRGSRLTGNETLFGGVKAWIWSSCMSLVNRSLIWYRFLIILSVAYTISLVRGPGDLQCGSHFIL